MMQNIMQNILRGITPEMIAANSPLAQGQMAPQAPGKAPGFGQRMDSMFSELGSGLPGGMSALMMGANLLSGGSAPQAMGQMAGIQSAKMQMENMKLQQQKLKQEQMVRSENRDAALRMYKTLKGEFAKNGLDAREQAILQAVESASVTGEPVDTKTILSGLKDADSANAGPYAGTGATNQAMNQYLSIGRIPPEQRTPEQQQEYDMASWKLSQQQIVSDPNMPTGFRVVPGSPPNINFGRQQPLSAGPQQPSPIQGQPEDLRSYFSANTTVPENMWSPVKQAAMAELKPQLISLAQKSMGLFGDQGLLSSGERAFNDWYQQNAQTNPQYKTYTDSRGSIGATFARAKGEKGTLTDEDINRVLRVVPDPSKDSAPVAVAKWKAINAEYNLGLPDEFFNGISAQSSALDPEMEARYWELKRKQQEGTLQ